jgi:predicted RNA-binding protein
MTKLCPRGKAAAKRKFSVYPSAYANAYASKICAGKIKDPSGVKRKDFKGRKKAAAGGLMEATERLRRQGIKRGGIAKGCGRAVMSNKRKVTKVF